MNSVGDSIQSAATKSSVVGSVLVLTCNVILQDGHEWPGECLLEFANRRWIACCDETNEGGDALEAVLRESGIAWILRDLNEDIGKVLENRLSDGNHGFSRRRNQAHDALDQVVVFRNLFRRLSALNVTEQSHENRT